MDTHSCVLYTVSANQCTIYSGSAWAHNHTHLHPPSSVSGPHVPIRACTHRHFLFLISPSRFLSSLTSHYLCVVRNLIPLTARLAGEEPTGEPAPLELPQNKSAGVGWCSAGWVLLSGMGGRQTGIKRREDITSSIGTQRKTGQLWSRRKDGGTWGVREDRKWRRNQSTKTDGRHVL